MKKIGLLLIAMMFLIIAACGANDEGIETVSSEQEKKETEINKEAEESSEELVISHAAGETLLTKYPENIVTLSVLHTDYLLALGITPIATGTYDYQGMKHLPYLGEKLADVEGLGNFQKPNLEKLVTISPDLIIGDKHHLEGYDSINKIAPTVILENAGNWRDFLREIAVIVGKEAEAEKVIAEYDAKASDAKEKLNEVIGDETVAYIRIRPKELMVYGAAWNVGDVLYEDLGLTPASCVPLEDWAQPVSLEVLPECNPDHILIQVDAGEEAEEKLIELQESSIWKGLSAVENGNVIPVEHWFIVTGPLSNQTKVDLLMNAVK